MIAEPPRPELCVGAVAVRDGRILLIQRGREPGKGRWSVPGGRVDAGETMEQAVVRELEEETGLVADCGPLIGWIQRIGPAHHYVIFDFAVDVRSDDEPVAGDDAADAGWVPLGQLQSLPMADGVIEFLVEHDVLESGG